MQAATRTANTLLEALPYIQMHAGTTIVVKLGGNAMVEPRAAQAVAQDVVLMERVGIRTIVVHGAGPKITETMEKQGLEAQFVEGLRVTDDATIEIAQMVLVGLTGKEIVAEIEALQAKAASICGLDGSCIRVRKAERSGADLGWVGEVVAVDPLLINTLAGSGHVVVISPIGVGPEGHAYNINADHAAGHIAAAVGAAKIVNLTNVAGLLGDPQDPESLISSLSLVEARQMLSSGAVSSGMIPKLEGCIIALEGGVQRAHLIDGTLSHSLLMELFTDTGIGTMIEP